MAGRDSNPIENAFAKLKARQRKAAVRTTDDLCSVIDDSLEAFTPAERRQTTTQPSTMILTDQKML